MSQLPVSAIVQHRIAIRVRGVELVCHDLVDA